MPSTKRLRELGLFEARVPRYTSYPPANHFTSGFGAQKVESWLHAIPSGGRVSLYLHIPYCRRLCWFCACRTQGTSTDRPLVPYLALLEKELDLISERLRDDVIISQIHLGGGTPTLLPPDLIRRLGAKLAAFRPWADDLEFSVEIDPTEVDAARIEALSEIGMTRASIGVQDFDPEVQAAIGRLQPYETTRDVVQMLRAAGVGSVNMDILYGLPFQTRTRMADSVRKVLSMSPDRVALYGYAHVPWMAKRQVLIPEGALPDAEERLVLFDTAREMFVEDGYAEIGIDHYARTDDKMAAAARDGSLHRNFQGYTVDPSDVLIGVGASAISRYPQGFAQNNSISSKYATAIDGGRLATDRGHTMTAEDALRSAMIERLMCDMALDTRQIAMTFGVPQSQIQDMTQRLRERFSDHIQVRDGAIRLTRDARLIARLVAKELDAYLMPEGRHSQAL